MTVVKIVTLFAIERAVPCVVPAPVVVTGVPNPPPPVVAQLPAEVVTDPVSAGIAAHGNAVALVRTSAVGVPRAGETSVGDVA